MKFFTFVLVFALCACANQSFRDQARQLCSQPLAPGEVEDMIQTNNCIDATEQQLISQSNAYHMQHMSNTFGKMHTDAMATMPKTSNCVMIGNSASCTGR